MAWQDGDGYIHVVDRKSNKTIGGSDNVQRTLRERIVTAATS